MMYVITVIKNCSFLALASASLDDLLPCQGDSQGAGGEIYVEKIQDLPAATQAQLEGDFPQLSSEITVAPANILMTACLRA